MNRALLLSTGLYDTGRVDVDGEWATTGWTSWYPGAGQQQPSFRARMVAHCASFVRFCVPDSVTHADVAAQVDDAYQQLERGDRSGEEVISKARFFSQCSGRRP